MQVVKIPSPFGFARANKPNEIIIHAMGEFVAGKFAPDFLRSVELSAHALVTPSGVIIETRPPEQGAYHAARYNRASLGVEILVPGVHDYATFLKAIKTDWVTPQAFNATVELVRGWRERFGIDAANIARHSDKDPDRKHDPGVGFQWERFLKEIAN